MVFAGTTRLRVVLKPQRSGSYCGPVPKRGFSFGESDDVAYNPAQAPVHVHDFQATVLHLLDIDHERLTYEIQGRYFRVTDVHGRVVNEILA